MKDTQQVLSGRAFRIETFGEDDGRLEQRPRRIYRGLDLELESSDGSERQ